MTTYVQQARRKLNEKRLSQGKRAKTGHHAMWVDKAQLHVPVSNNLMRKRTDEIMKKDPMMTVSQFRGYYDAEREYGAQRLERRKKHAAATRRQSQRGRGT